MEKGKRVNLLYRSSGLSVILVCLFCSEVFAFHPLITDDAGTQGKGKFQLEINGDYGHDEDEGVITKRTQTLSTLSYGLSDPVDLIIGLPYQHIRTEDSGYLTKQEGLADMSLEIKWRFYEKDGLGFALKPGLTFPTGDDRKGLGSGRVTYRLFFIGTKEIKPWAFHFNLGYIRNENTFGENIDLWHGSLASSFEINTDLKLVGNIGIERNADPNLNDPKAFILGGVIYSLFDNFDIDFGVKGGLTKTEEDYTILMGLTWRF